MYYIVMSSTIETTGNTSEMPMNIFKPNTQYYVIDNRKNRKNSYDFRKNHSKSYDIRKNHYT